ncbi:hypothetical protein UA08_01487 [Talaromyces atroroseus]|uniref:Mis12-Mtw1 family protein n=1 Tax=Talaromyces atroroseus TaxID=1441469 RepID=A0A1Q5QCH3_TALAT|nr:hypothetical protein UA08_01487 [Talaromyces atroroseus]OKL63588.1 hypothetical protein UA08_01487 [Talaromyces atroroseus]
MTVTVLTTTATRTARREPLKVIDMAASQGRPASSVRGNGEKGRGKRTSSRLNAKEIGVDEGAFSSGNFTQERSTRNATKRNATAYDEDIGGFQFSRATTAAKKLKSGLEEPIPDDVAIEKAVLHSPRRGRPPKNHITQPSGDTIPEDIRPSTRNGKAPKGRPKRVSLELQGEVGQTRKRGEEPPFPTEKPSKKGRPAKARPSVDITLRSPEPSQGATSKIALPLADTPVIRRNKEMREGRAGNGPRRNSLGMRGRRATLPHREVPTSEFYKHIASDGLSEPRRMRQLLTWCATRAMDDKPSGSRSDDDSARLAARVIQEELLQDLSNKSELSDWFSREDAPAPTVIVKKPNPKNIQNAEKIKELEDQIRRLQNERHALNALLRVPSIPTIESPSEQAVGDDARPKCLPNIDETILDPSQQSILATLAPGGARKRYEGTQNEPERINTTPPAHQPLPPATITRRLSRITSSLAPTLDAFASGLHDIDIYRSAADRLSHQMLKVCSEQLEERDNRSSDSAPLHEAPEDGDTYKDKNNFHRKIALRTRQQREDLSLILGALSRVERR